MAEPATAEQATEEQATEETTVSDTSGPEAVSPANESEQQELEEAHRAANAANRAKIGRIHAVAAVTTLILFGAAHTWAAASGWQLAAITSVIAAFMAGIVLASLAHEWGHFSGAMLSQSRVTVAEAPVNYFFMFNFDIAANDTRQALWMSWGGLAGSWGLVVALALLVPQDSWASAVLVATVFGTAVNASVFEVPVALRTRHSHDLGSELAAQLKSPGLVKLPGLFAGIALAALLGL